MSLSSCNYFFQKKEDLKTIDITPIDFKSVDAYPLLPECEQFSSRKLQQSCFYKFISRRIESALSKQKIILSTDLQKDTIKTTIIINSKGKISVKSINLEDKEDNKSIINAINQSVDAMPIIKPAIKAGIPVTTAFVLPIVLKPNR